MIISRTPLRLSFLGGGTDLEEFYKQEGGAVLSTAVDKYIFATINKKFDDHIRISYSKTENVEKVNEVQHELVREAMKITGVDRGIEITTVADIPSHGTGLGSSSSFTVGLLNVLYAYKGEKVSAERLASEACRIEIDIVGEPIGKQDQYIASYGGLQFIQFNKDGSVSVDPINCNQAIKDALQNNIMLFYTGITRRASTILSEQKANSAVKKNGELKALKDLAIKAKRSLEVDKSVDEIGHLLDENWRIKKSLATGVTKPEIDDIYASAKAAGALGGKIAGAGGGGFLLLYVPLEKQKAVSESLSKLREMKIKFENQGSRIIYR